MATTSEPRQRRTPLQRMWRHVAVFVALMVAFVVTLVAASGGR